MLSAPITYLAGVRKGPDLARRYGRVVGCRNARYQLVDPWVVGGGVEQRVAGRALLRRAEVGKEQLSVIAGMPCSKPSTES